MAINVRRFTRASPSSVTFDNGSWDPFGTRSLANSAHSWAAIIRLKSTGVEQTIVDAFNGGTTVEALYVNSSNNLCLYTTNFGVVAVSSFTLSSDVWYLVGASLDYTDNSRARFHLYNFDTSTWTHSADDETFQGNNDATDFRVGDNSGTGGPTGAGDFEALIIGIFTSAVSDANYETLDNDGSGGFPSWLSFGGTVWRFDQAVATTDVLDLDAFNADETAESNTTVVSVTEPSGWGEDAGGGGTTIKTLIGGGFIEFAA